MAEIASKWDAYSDVQQSGIATALAGTRQRENLITMFENWDLVQKYEQISANSYGTAAQKMEAYTDSVEAARQRITTSVEKFVLSIQTSGAIKTFYNVVADLTENMYALAAAVGIFMLAINPKSTAMGFLGGTNTIQQKLVNFNMAQIKMGQANYGLLNKGGIINGREVNSLTESFNESFLSSQKELFSKTITQTIDGLDSMDEASRTMLKDGMIPLQNSMIELDSAQKKELSAVLLRQGQEYQFALNREQQISLILNDRMIEASLGMVGNEKKKAILAQIQQVQASTITEEQLQQAEKDEILRRRMAAKIIDDSPDEVRQSLRGNVAASSRITPRSALRDTVLSMGGFALGGAAGGAIGSRIGSGWATAGASIGAVIGNVASSTLVAQLSSGATLLGAISGLSWLGPVFAGILVAGLISAIKSSKDSMKKEFAETASEAATEYTNTLNASADSVNFDKLVQGVDYLGRNVSLTDDEYQSFLDSSNALAETFPELVVRTDELGNKFVGPDGLSGQVGEVTEKINELTEASRKAADSELFKMQSTTFLRIKTGESSGFSNVFDEQKEKIDKAKKSLYTQGYTLGNGTAVTGLDDYISGQEKYLSTIEGGENGPNAKLYKATQKAIDSAKLKRNSLLEEINNASDVLGEYTEQLVSYANTASGQLSFEGQYDGLENQLNSLSAEAKNLVISSVKMSISDIDFENEADYENKVLDITTKMTTLFAENPVLVDFYYGNDTGLTIQEAQKARETVLTALKAAFPDGVFDSDTVQLLIKMGFVVDENGNIGVEDIKTRFAKALGVDTLSDGWSGFIDGLTDKQATLLYNEIQAGSIRYNPNNENADSKGYFENMGNWLNFKEYSAKSASTLANDYETLTRLIKETDDEVERSKLEKRLELTKKYLNGYAEQLGTVKGNYAEIIEKIEIMNGDLDRYGVSNASPDEVIEKGDSYQTLLDYLNDDYTGIWNPEKLAEVANDSALAPYIDDISRLKKVLTGYIDDMETYYNNALGNVLIQSEGGSKYLIELHEAEVNAFNEAYGVDLRNYATLEEAKNVVESTFFTNYQEDMVTWLTNNATQYGLDLETFSTMMGQKMALVSAFAQMLGQSNQDVERTINGYLQTHVGATLQDAYDYVWQNKISSDMTKMQEKLATIFDPEVKTSFDSTKTSQGSGKDNTVEDQLSAMEGIYQKEYYLRKSFKDFGNITAGSEASYMNKTYYAGLKNIYELESEYYAAKIPAGKAITEYTSDELGYLQKYQEAQIKINNLDDEEWEDRINILELQGASLEKLIEANKEYEKTSDSLQEHIERQQKILELEIQQLELHKEVSEWQRDNTDRLIERLSGDAYGNDAYDRAINQQISAVNEEMADTQSIISKYYAKAVEAYQQSGSSHAEALRLAYTGNNDYSEKLRSAMTDYYNLIDKRTEYTIKQMEDKADDLNRRLDLIEKEKPDEWFKIGDIDSYYTQRMDLLQKQVELYQDALKDTSDMTDEQIQNIVDSLNEATISLKEAQIDNLKDQTDLQSKQYDAIVYRINLWKDEIQDAIDAIEDAYDKEVKPLQEANDERERALNLEDKLAAKKAAEQAKERVFREGERQCPL